MLKQFALAGVSYLAAQTLFQGAGPLAGLTQSIEGMLPIDSRWADVLVIALASSAIFALLSMLVLGKAGFSWKALLMVFASYVATAALDQYVLQLDGGLLSCKPKDMLCNLGEMAVRAGIAGIVFVGAEYLLGMAVKQAPKIMA